jgi:hypothetical protein
MLPCGLCIPVHVYRPVAEYLVTSRTRANNSHVKTIKYLLKNYSVSNLMNVENLLTNA